MNSYTGLHARHFDLLYAEKPYVDEVASLMRVFEANGVQPGARLLELACGTGTHALEFARRGMSVVGVDICPELLAVAQAKAEGLPGAPQFICQDIRQLALGSDLLGSDLLGSDRFSVATCLFDSIGYLGEDSEIIEALSRVRNHLEPEGIVVEFLQRNTFLNHYEPVRVKERELPDGGNLIRIANTTVSACESRFNVRYRIIELRRDKTFAALTEHQYNRIFAPKHVAQILSDAGFGSAAFYRAYDLDADLSECWHILAVARRP